MSPGEGGGAAESPRALFLNSRITIYFSQDLDPLSVTSDAVRLVRVGGDGGTVKLHRSVRSRSVALEPRPPLTPSLDDGSLLPGRLYRLEVAGFPRTNSVTAKEGATLQTGWVCYFRAVSAGASETDLPHPFLPRGTPQDKFELRTDVKIAAAGGSLRIPFTLPVLPTSLSPLAFELHRYRAGVDRLDADPPLANFPRVAVGGVRILSLPRPVDPYPGSTVEVTFADPEAVQPGDLLYLRLRTEAGLRDYRGRPLTGSALGWRGLEVHSGTRPELLRIGASRARTVRPAFHAIEDRLGFEVHNGRIQPLVRREAGDGSHGVFRPKQSMTLEPGKPFELANGQTIVTGPNFNFRGVHIDQGITVTLRASRPVQLRSLGSIRIEGTLRLETPVSQQGPQRLDHDLRSLADIVMFAPVTLVAAGTIDIPGRITRQGGVPPQGCALALVAGGIHKQGRVPSGTIGVAPKDHVRVVGPEMILPSPHLGLTRGVPAGADELLAEAFTDWQRMKHDGRPVQIDLPNARDVEVFLQVAAPDPVDPERPFLDPRSLSTPVRLPLSGPNTLPEDCHVRFLLRARVRAGEPLPGLDAIVVRQL